MKNVFKNRILLAVAAAVSISALPAVAQEATMMERARASLPSMPQIKNPFAGVSNPFKGWTKEGLIRQLNSTMNRLDREMKDVFKCIKSGGTQCQSHRAEVLSLITTLVALVVALKVYSVGAKAVGKEDVTPEEVLNRPLRAGARLAIYRSGEMAEAPYKAIKSAPGAVGAGARAGAAAVGRAATAAKEKTLAGIANIRARFGQQPDAGVRLRRTPDEEGTALDADAARAAAAAARAAGEDE